MSNDSADPIQALPDRPNLRHLKNQAKDLLSSGDALSVSDAQFKIARRYGFSSWPQLKRHVESLALLGRLKNAIDDEDIETVKELMTRNPGLHRAPLGYSQNGPLTWVAECRVPSRPPSATRLAMAQWMIENGADVHQGGDGPLMRAALSGQRIPMMQLLISAGADPNAKWNGTFPIIFAPCETIDPAALQWLLDHGANPNPHTTDGASGLDYLIASYVRSPRLASCVDILQKAAGKTKYPSVVVDLLAGRLDLLEQYLKADPSLLERRFDELDFGVTAGRRLTLRGTTLLHVAAEYGNVEAAEMLLNRGADVDARATVNEAATGGQTPIFHAATQHGDRGLSVVQLLVEWGAELGVRARLPGHYERPGEFLECTPAEYAELFPGGANRTVVFLRETRREW